MRLLLGLPSVARTDLGIQELSGSSVQDCGDHLVVRTPDRTDYHRGNALYVTTGDPDDAGRWLERFAEMFPDATYRAIGLPRRPEGAGWSDLDIEASEALTSSRAPSPTDVPAGYDVRALDSDADWLQRVETECADNDGTYPAVEYRAFVSRQVRMRRALVASGHAVWFGAFTPDGVLAGSLGICDLGGVARYMSVITAVDHRCRGIARHLLTVAAEWALARGVDELVIAAEADSGAGRLYVTAGFTPAETSFAAYAPKWPGRTLSVV
jgi:GNAT superfamily N-acetyltransferase